MLYQELALANKAMMFVAALAVLFLTICAPTGAQLDGRVQNLEARIAAAEARLNVLQAARPSAHLDGGQGQVTRISDDSDVTFWNPSSGRSHLSGGFTYNTETGTLRVPQTGRYFVYAQLWNFQAGHVRHFIYASGRRLAVAGTNNGQSETTWTGGVFRLNAGDLLTVRLNSRSSNTVRQVWPGSAHTFYGAFLV